MSDACGCGHEEPDTPDVREARAPAKLWQVREIRFAAVSGLFLLASWMVGLTDSAPWVLLVLEALALLAGAYTFVPSTLRRLAKG